MDRTACVPSTPLAISTSPFIIFSKHQREVFDGIISSIYNNVALTKGIPECFADVDKATLDHIWCIFSNRAFLINDDLNKVDIFFVLGYCIVLMLETLQVKGTLLDRNDIIHENAEAMWSQIRSTLKFRLDYSVMFCKNHQHTNHEIITGCNKIFEDVSIIYLEYVRYSFVLQLDGSLF